VSHSVWKWKALFAIAIITAASTGCSKSQTGSADSTSGTEVTKVVDDGGWWCKEHGVPEKECALCDPSLVAKFKDAKDWCKEHNRPESQCYLCDPSRFDKFAAQYEAKFGVKPPKPTE